MNVVWLRGSLNVPGSRARKDEWGQDSDDPWVSSEPEQGKPYPFQ